MGRSRQSHDHRLRPSRRYADRGSGTISIVTKGPLTNGATSTRANGFLGAYLRFNGYDAIVLQGASPTLVSLCLGDGRAEIRDAAHLAGKDTWETQAVIVTLDYPSPMAYEKRELSPV